MRFEETSLPGTWLVHDSSSQDERGSFNRLFCADEFKAHGIPHSFVQMGMSRTPRRGTLRGIHFQRDPMAEGKLIRCLRGHIFDVVIDLRRQSQTFRKYFAVELRGDAAMALYAPPGLAHGFLTLSDDVEVLYAMTQPYGPGLADGVRFDDPAFAITWPEPVLVASERDRSFPDFV